MHAPVGKWANSASAQFASVANTSFGDTCLVELLSPNRPLLKIGEVTFVSRRRYSVFLNKEACAR